MHIIFGDAINEISDSFTVLELDTFQHSSEEELTTAYCVVEKIPVAEMATLDAWKKIHQDLIANYKKREWNYCEHAVEGLMGKWGGELDTFYTDMLQRVVANKENPPGDDWDGILRPSAKPL